MKHIPVLKNEVLNTFNCLENKDGFFVDGTLGAGGHSIAIAQNHQPSTMNHELIFIGIDKDQVALDISKKNIAEEGLKNSFILVHDDFKNIENILTDLSITKINGALIDLGVSSMQLDDKDRGFSFTDPDVKLDMRMDRSQELSAFDVINYYSVEKLEKIFREYGEERFSKKIARNICRKRKEGPIEKVGDLLQALKESIPSKIIATSKKHFATNVFRALRLEVNQELTKLDKALFDFIEVLEPGARLAVISFHSTEDRIVKEAFKKAENPCICPPLAPICTCGKNPLVRVITRKPIAASEEELHDNPRARSAKLRVVEKL